MRSSRAVRCLIWHTRSPKGYKGLHCVFFIATRCNVIHSRKFQTELWQKYKFGNTVIEAIFSERQLTGARAAARAIPRPLRELKQSEGRERAAARGGGSAERGAGAPARGGRGARRSAASAGAAPPARRSAPRQPKRHPQLLTDLCNNNHKPSNSYLKDLVTSRRPAIKRRTLFYDLNI